MIRVMAEMFGLSALLFALLTLPELWACRRMDLDVDVDE